MKSTMFSLKTKKKIIEAVEEALIECGLQHTFNIVDQNIGAVPFKQQPSKVKISLNFQFSDDGKSCIVCQPEVKL